MIGLLDVRTKLILGLGAALILIGLAMVGADHFEAKGRALERATWLAKQVQEQQAEAALVAKHDADMRALQEKHELIERKTSEQHEQELAQLRRERDADRAAVDHAGGLRISADACPSSRAEPAAAAASAGGRDAAGSAPTVRLPQPVEDGLWRLADDADEVSAQLRACQAWIRANGFYGKDDAVGGQLLDRITAEQKSGEEHNAEQ